MLWKKEEFDEKKQNPAEQIAYLREVLQTKEFEIYGKIKKKMNNHMYIIPYNSYAQPIKLFEDEDKDIKVNFRTEQSDKFEENMYIKAIYRLQRPEDEKRNKECKILIESDTIECYRDYDEFLDDIEYSFLESADLDIKFDDKAFIDFPDGTVVINEWAAKLTKKAIEKLWEKELAEIQSKKEELKTEKQNLESELIGKKSELTEIQKKIGEFEQKKTKITEQLEQKKNEVEEYTKMGIIFPYFNIEDKNSQKTESTKVPVRQLADDVWRKLWKEKDLRYEDSIIKRFLLALHTNQIVLLVGKPGTGKTTLPQAVAEVIGAKYEVISVQPNWTDNQDLLGFYNLVDERYVSTLFMDTLAEAKENQDKLYFIVLDEMNLAHIEYYFSEVLSAISSETPLLHLYSSRKQENIKNLWKEAVKAKDKEMMDKLRGQINDINTYPAKFYIPKNVRFIGTLNEDATTKSLSPKVIDRSYMIEIEKLSEYELAEQKAKIEGKTVNSYHVVAKQFEPNTSLKSEEIREYSIYKKLLELQKDLLAFEYLFSNRFENYMGQLFMADTKENWESDTEILDEIILDKVLTNIDLSRADKQKVKDLINKFSNSPYKCEKCANKLTKILNSLEKSSFPFYS